MPNPCSILAIDIGSMTQDILLFDPHRTEENMIKMVFPSWSYTSARRISHLTYKRRNIYLKGQLSGGGPVVQAILHHIDQGLKVSSNPLAAMTISENLDTVRELGVDVTEHRPNGYTPVHLKDIDLFAIKDALLPFDVEIPATMGIAVQDHGYAPDISSQKLRFHYWEEFIESGGLLKDLIFTDIPQYLTRMTMLKKTVPDAFLADTGGAAILGTLFDEEVKRCVEKGCVIVNIGNTHTLGALVKGERVYGIFEHHTGLLNVQKFENILKDFKNGILSHEDVFDDKGHGSIISPDYKKVKDDFDFIALTGPRKRSLRGRGYYFPAPYGEMLMTGCLGLAYGIQKRLSS